MRKKAFMTIYLGMGAENREEGGAQHKSPNTILGIAT